MGDNSHEAAGDDKHGGFLLKLSFSTCRLSSRKLSKLDKPDMQDTAGEAGTSS